MFDFHDYVCLAASGGKECMVKMKKYINKNSLSLIMMIILSLFTQLLTIAKTSLVAGTFGLSLEMDAYNFANSIVSLLFGLFAGGIPAVIIPSYIRKEKRIIIDSFLTLIYGFLLVSIIIILIFRYQIVGIFSNRNELFVNIVCNILLILFSAQYFMSITEIVVAYFQCKDKYNFPKIVTLISQFIVVVALILNKNLNIYEYTIIVACGILFNFAIDILGALKYGWRYKPSFDFLNKEVIKMLKIFFPIVLSCSVYNISLFLDSTIASRLEIGKLSILSYSNQISGIINTVIVGNLILYIYPKIITKIEKEQNQNYFWNQSFLFHSIVILITIGFIVIGKEAISLLFEHGSFDSIATNSVFIGTIIYIIGMQFNIIRDMIYRYFYAMSDTKTPAINSIIVSLLNIAFSLVLVYLIGFYGIIIGTILASFFSLVFILFKFNKKLKINFSKKKILLSYMMNLLVGILTLSIVLITKNIFPINSKFIAIIIYGLETVIVYISLCILINKNVIYSLKTL